MDDGELVLPSAGPRSASPRHRPGRRLGYARGRRPFHYRAPNARTGRWVELPAFAYERFDRRMGSVTPLGEPDILTAEGLPGRLDQASWSAMKAVLDEVAPLADAAVARAAGRPFGELPDDEFSVLAEPGTVGAWLRSIRQHCAELPGVPAQHVTATLHARRPSLFPLLSPVTRRQLLPHVHEGDCGVEAVIHREVRANRSAFGRLADELAALGIALTALRLHDVLLWLSGTLRLTHAVALGQSLQAGSRPV